MIYSSNYIRVGFIPINSDAELNNPQYNLLGDTVYHNLNLSLHRLALESENTDIQSYTVDKLQTLFYSQLYSLIEDWENILFGTSNQ